MKDTAAGQELSQIQSRLTGSYLKVLKKPNVAVVIITLFFTYGSFLSWFFMLPLYLRELGASEENVGVSYLLFQLFLCVLQFPGGLIADRIGRKKLIEIPTYLLPVFLLITAFAKNWIVAVIAVSGYMFFSGIQMPAFYSIMAESVEPEDRSLAFSLFEIAISASFAAGPGIGSLTAHSYTGIRSTIMACAFIILPCAVLRSVFMKDTISQKNIKTDFRRLFLSIDKNLKYMLFSFIFMIFMLNTTIYGPFITLYSKDMIEMPERTIQLMFMTGGIFAVFFNLIAGRITQKIGPKRAYIQGCLIHAIMFLPWLFSSNYPYAIPIYVVSYLFLQFAYIGHSTIITNLTGEETRSSVIGLFGMISGLLGSAAPFIATKAILFSDHSAPFILAFLYSIISIMFVIPIKSEAI